MAPQTSFADGLEELLRFTLSYSVVKFTDVSAELSRQYCDNLLRDDPLSPPSQISPMAVGGVPAYPLYKQLASALEGCIRSGTFFRELRPVKGLSEDESLKSKQSEWDVLIMQKRLELLNMMENVLFDLHVQEPFFSQLREGLKIVEGRCAIGDYNRISAGDLILFNRSLLLKVQNVKHYSSFAEMLEVELANAFPGIHTVDEGVQIYRKFYTEEKEKSNGVMAIHILKPASQPYISLGSLLSGLGCEGVGRLLGMMHTAGTISDALPPPRSHLLSSFMELHRPNVEGCTLTKSARSLSKHIHRSNEGWWGCFRGGDFEKNELALEVANRFLNECCWMNIYNIQNHGQVFEIRVHEGYGARWSHDGSKVKREGTPDWQLLWGLHCLKLFLADMIVVSCCSILSQWRAHSLIIDETSARGSIETSVGLQYKRLNYCCAFSFFNADDHCAFAGH